MKFYFTDSHPKYRAALNKKIPTLVCGEVKVYGSEVQSTVSQVTNWMTSLQ